MTPGSLGRDEAVVEQRPRLSRSKSSRAQVKRTRRSMRAKNRTFNSPSSSRISRDAAHRCRAPAWAMLPDSAMQTNVLRAEVHFFFSQFLHEDHDYKCIGHIKHV